MDTKLKLNRKRLSIFASAMVFGLIQSNPLSAQNDTVFWPRLDFVIPFQIDANGQLPQEVILEVSDNDGVSWKTCSRGDTRTRQFHYKAAQDGAFQFRLKTVDAEGRRFNNPGDPLKIVVDTEKPSAKLATAMDPQGAMQVEFLVSDIALDIESLQLEYQTDSTAEWKTIPFHIEESTTTGEWTGFGTWRLPNNSKQLVVRLVAKDKAGNTTEATKFPSLPKTAASKSIQLASQPRSSEMLRLVSRETDDSPAPVIGSGVTDRTPTLPRVENLGKPETVKPETVKPSDPNAIRSELLQEYQLLVEQQQKLLQQRREVDVQRKLELESNVSGDSRGLANQGSPVSFNSKTPDVQEPTVPLTIGRAPVVADTPTHANFPVRTLTEEELKARQIEPLHLADTRSNSSNSNFNISNNDARPSILMEGSSSFPTSLPKPPRSIEMAPSFEPTRNLPPMGAVRPQVNIVQDMPTSLNPTLLNQDNSTPVLQPREFSRDVKPLFANTKTFSLDYRVDNDPGAPIRDVELWGTTDQGQTWSVWGSDPDRRTPFDIEVETDGLFGFRMVIIGSNGLASNRPRNGDNADAWIHVDTNKPLVKINSALYGTGNEAGSLIIEYQAKDEFFGDRPVSLFYGETPEGPWQAISRNVRNQGRFAWPADPNLPPSIYLKIEAMDSAGNIANSVLDLPVNVEGIAPRGFIQGFRPIQRP